MSRLWLVTTALVIAAARVSAAWGTEGHGVVAMIAERNMSGNAREKGTAILGGASLVDVASWADEIRRSRPETGPWPYPWQIQPFT